MKRSFICIIFCIIAICVCGCKQISSNVETNPMIDTNGKKWLVSEESAIAIVENLLSEQYDSIVCEIDRVATIDNIKYYCVHAYVLGSQPVDTAYMRFTIGWYFVDVQTGEVYVENTDKSIEKDIVPVRQKKAGDGSLS